MLFFLSVQTYSYLKKPTRLPAVLLCIHVNLSFFLSFLLCLSLDVKSRNKEKNENKQNKKGRLFQRKQQLHPTHERQDQTKQHECVGKTCVLLPAVRRLRILQNGKVPAAVRVLSGGTLVHAERGVHLPLHVQAFHQLYFPDDIHSHQLAGLCALLRLRVQEEPHLFQEQHR